MRRTRTTTGSKSPIVGFALILSLLSGGVLLAEKRSKQQATESVSLIAVTVFREPGFAVPGAELLLAPASTENAPSKVKSLKGTTDSRGEFVFRVPPAKAEYKVSVAVRGMKPQDKKVFIQGEERVDATFMLEQESK